MYYVYLVSENFESDKISKWKDVLKSNNHWVNIFLYNSFYVKTLEIGSIDFKFKLC